MKKVGIYQQNWGKSGWEQHYVGSIVQILSENNEVSVIHHEAGLQPEVYAERMDLDLSRVEFQYLPVPEHPDWSSCRGGAQFRLESEFCKEYSEPYNLFIAASRVPPVFNHARQGIHLTTFPQFTFDEYFQHDSESWKSRGFFSRYWRMKCHRVEWRCRFSSYSMTLCPSLFARQWCWRRWQVSPKVLYPSPRTDFFRAEKKPLIVSVGTFSAKNGKRQDLLISAFQDFYDRMVCKFDLSSDWKMCMMGYCSDSDEDRAFVEKLRVKAYGYPVEIVTNADALTLKNMMSEATFLWGATGYELSEETTPDLVDCFAITAAEAQAAGTIPMLFHTGSAAEVIHHGMNGFLWSTFRELVETTTAILIEERILPILEVGALKNAENFNQEAFRGNLLKIMNLFD